jgi:LEA14-like dessication related protein
MPRGKGIIMSESGNEHSYHPGAIRVVWGLLLPVCLFVSGCRKPEVTLSDIGVNSLSFENLGISLVIDVHNPNIVDIPLESLAYRFEAGGEKFAVGELPQPLPKIKAGQTIRLTAPVDIAYRRLKPVVELARSGENIPYTTGVDAMVKVWFFEIPVSKEFSGEFERFVAPKWKLRNVSLRHLPTPALVLHFEIENPNAFHLSLAGLSGALTLGGEPILEIAEHAVTPLPAEQMATLEVPVRLRATRLLTALSSALARGEKPQFRGDFQLAEPANFRDLFILPKREAANDGE